jgi:hypothetical protein
MASFIVVITVIAFLSGGVTAVFIMLVIGIRKGDRPRRLSGPCNTPLDTFTRTTLGASTWPGSPVVHGDDEEN